MKDQDLFEVIGKLLRELQDEMRDGFDAHQRAWTMTLAEMRRQTAELEQRTREAENAKTLLERRSADAQLNSLLSKRRDECLAALRNDARAFLDHEATAEPSDYTHPIIRNLAKAFSDG